MKRGEFTPKPGELFQWYYDHNDTKCLPKETIWSTYMKCLVPCDGTNLLIALTDTDIWWLNTNSFIHTHVDDTTGDFVGQDELRLHPRARG